MAAAIGRNAQEGGVLWNAHRSVSGSLTADDAHMHVAFVLCLTLGGAPRLVLGFLTASCRACNDDLQNDSLQ